MALIIRCDICGTGVDDDCDFYIVRSFGITLGDRIPVYAKSCDEVVMCNECFNESFKKTHEPKVVE